MSLHTPPPWSVFRELNYTPPERDRGGRKEGKKKKKQHEEKNRDREMERKMEFALPCETSNLEEQFCGAAQPKRQVRWSRGWHRSRSYCTVSCHGNNLNWLMRGSLIVTNTVTETRLSSCSGKSTQSTYRPVLFPWFTVSWFVLLVQAQTHEGQTIVLYFYAPVRTDLCKALWAVWSISEM